MKLGLKALVLALVMVLAAVPAAFAKGNGGGKPSWAGSGHASVKALHEKKAKKAKKVKHQRVESTSDEGTQSEEVDLEGLNPAWYCKTLRDEMSLASQFADMFGTNPNGANAFGKCVSRRAHGEDLSGAVDGDDQQENCDTTAEPPAVEGTETGAEESGTDTTASDDGATQEEGSDDEATDPEACETDDSASEEPAEDEQGEQDGEDEQGENEQGGDEGDATDEGDSSDLGAALRFLRF
ncbi:MAG: hypothetical protein ABI649_00470 [Gaiellaceae bacterium]